MNSLVSVIVPVYNKEDVLSRCLNSIKNQSYTYFEVLLVNDGSKDSSLDVCNYYSKQDERILVIDKPNGGVSSARNVGLDVAKGKFVMFCDSDDIVNCDWCKIMLEEYEDNTLTMCKYVEVEADKLTDYRKTIVDYNVQIFDRCRFLLFREIGIGSPTTKIFDNSIITVQKTTGNNIGLITSKNSITFENIFLYLTAPFSAIL